MGFKVQPNHTIAYNGKRFLAVGVQMFDYLFCSFETGRLNYNYRKIYSPVYAYPYSNVSEPTYHAKTQYIDEANVILQLTTARDLGCNLIRVNIEPAIRYATACYVDPTDGLTYPADLTMLDQIISHAEDLGIVVQLQNANDFGSTSENVTFLDWLGDRYKNQENVWINPANELNGANNSGANVNNATMWQTAQQQYVAAIRAAGFNNPICLDPPGWGERIDLIASMLTTNVIFKNDPNLIIQPHYYPATGETNFRTAKLPSAKTMWFDYVNQFCILVGECGMDNLAGRLDPNLDAGIGSVSLTNFNNAKAAVTDFLQWAVEQMRNTSLNGVIGHMWGAFIPGLGYHDDNSMRRQNGTWSTWGGIYRDTFMSPPVFNIAQLVQGYPALLGPKMGNGSIGTPNFQTEGVNGVCAAAADISPNGLSPIRAFLRRDNGAMIGLISGNGTGVSYGTTSDYRLKEDLAEITEEDVLAFFNCINPVMATWIGTDIREAVLIADEFAKVMPQAVQGEKDGPDYQTVDYSKPMAMVLAALQLLLEERLICKNTTTNSQH